MIDGTFPDVQRIIPTSCVSKMLVDSYEIAGTIDRTNFIRNDKVHLIKLECTPQETHVKTYSSEIGNSDENGKYEFEVNSLANIIRQHRKSLKS